MREYPRSLEVERIYQGVIRDLRQLEAELPFLRPFDLSTLPARRPGELDAFWRYRQLDALQAYLRDLASSLQAEKA